MGALVLAQHHRPVCIKADQDEQHNTKGQQRSSPIAHKRQRYTNYRRQPYRHTVGGMPGYGDILDDTIDNFNTQSSSQWDSLAHFRHPSFGLYNGFPEAQIAGRGGKRLQAGVQRQ